MRTELTTTPYTGNSPEGGSGLLGMFMMDFSLWGLRGEPAIVITPPWLLGLTCCVFSWLFWVMSWLLVVMSMSPPVVALPMRGRLSQAMPSLSASRLFGSLGS